MESRQFNGIDRVALFKAINPLDFNESTKNKQIKNADVILSCHPDAEKAFTTWYALTKDQWSLSNWTDRRYHLFLKHQTSSLYLIINAPPKGKAASNPNYLFFNMFGIVRSFLRSKNHEKVPVKLLDGADINKIQYLAWREVVKLLFSEIVSEVRNEVLNRDVGLPNFRDLINKNMPTHLKLEFFNTRNLEVEQLIEEVGINRRQYDYLVAKRKSLNSRSIETSNIFFPQIKRDAKDDI